MTLKVDESPEADKQVFEGFIIRENNFGLLFDLDDKSGKMRTKLPILTALHDLGEGTHVRVTIEKI